MSDTDDFLSRCDDVISDWEGSADSAKWSADGSHEQEPGVYIDCRVLWGEPEVVSVSDERTVFTLRAELLTRIADSFDIPVGLLSPPSVDTQD